MADFVETYDEPYHRRRFENAWVRTYDALIPSGAVTLYHRHTEDTFYVSVAAARTQEQTLGEAPGAIVDVPAGIAICRPHRSEPLIHQVTNHGSGDMRMIGAEVKDTAGDQRREAAELPAHELSWERERLRAYRIRLAPGESTGLIGYEFAGITVCTSTASLLRRDAGRREYMATCQAGDTLWHGEPIEFSLTNVGESPYEAFLAEWR